jgi:small subunit ribosomal protein S19
MNRSKWKGTYLNKYLLTKWEEKEFNYNRTSIIKTTSRSSTILKEFIGFMFEIHTGKTYFKTTITPDMVNRKFGELAFTRIHSLPKKKGKRKIILKKKKIGTKS